MNKGFSLIELMIAVAIIAILAAFAIPSFNRYTEQAKLSEATYYLATGATDQLRTHEVYGTYADRLTGATETRPALQIDFPSPKYDMIVGQPSTPAPSLSALHPAAFPTGFAIFNPGAYGVIRQPSGSVTPDNFILGVEGWFGSAESGNRFVIATNRQRNVWLLCDGHQDGAYHNATAGLWATSSGDTAFEAPDLSNVVCTQDAGCGNDCGM